MYYFTVLSDIFIDEGPLKLKWSLFNTFKTREECLTAFYRPDYDFESGYRYGYKFKTDGKYLVIEPSSIIRPYPDGDRVQLKTKDYELPRWISTEEVKKDYAQYGNVIEVLTNSIQSLTWYGVIIDPAVVIEYVSTSYIDSLPGPKHKPYKEPDEETLRAKREFCAGLMKS